MPRLIDFGQGYGTVSFPDDATDEQIVAEYDKLESDRARAITEARLVTSRLSDVAEESQPTIGKTLIRTGLGIREGAVGGAKEALGSIARGAADLLAIPQSRLQQVPDQSNPELPINVLREAGRSLQEEGATQRREASELGQSVGGGIPGAIGQSLGETAGVSTPSLLAAPLGLPAAAVTAGLQSYGLTASQFKDILKQRNPNLSDDEAFQQAQIPAAISGAITGILTRSFGGVERLIERIAKEGISRQGVKGILSDASRAALLEFPEESLDQLAQGLTEKAFVNPDKPIGEIVNEAGMAGLQAIVLGGVTGGGISTVATTAGGIVDAITEPSRMRRGTERRRAVISDAVDRGELLPQQTGAQNAKGTGITTATAGQEAGTVQETPGSVRVRDDAQAGLEAQAPIDIQRVVSSVTSNWANAPRVVVVPDISGLPAETQEAMRRRGLDRPGVTVKAAVGPDGTIYMLANAITSEDEAKRYLLHEAIGHAGVEGIIEDRGTFEEFMRGVAERHTETELGLRVRSVYGSGDQVLVGREIVAKLAENPAEDPSLWQQIVAAVRGWVRKVFNIEVSDNEIQVLLSRARRSIESGRNVRAGAPDSQAAAEPGPIRIPIQIRRKDGTVVDGEFTGYYDLTEFGKGAVPSVGFRLPNGNMTHSLLAEGEEIIGEVPPFDQWKSDRSGGSQFAAEGLPQFFQSRQQVTEATSSPGLKPDQIQEAEDLAKIQASMATDEIVGWIMGTPVDDAEAYAQKKLAYIEDRRHLSPAQQQLSTLPYGTTEQQRLKELAGALVLGHYGTDRAMERQINRQLEADQLLITEAVKKIGKITQSQMKANFLESLFKTLTYEYRQYLIRQSAAAPAAQNLQAQWRERLADAERRLNDQVQSPVAVQKALSAIASQIPDSFLVPLAHTNLDIVNWANQSGVLNGVVGSGVSDWMLVDDGTGYPAMLGYTSLIKDLRVLKDVLTKQQEVGNDIDAFEKWFRPSGKTGKVSAKQFAENYFKFRTGRDRALKIVSATEKEIENLDTRIRGNIMARDRLQTMMTSPSYVATVREAADKADVVIRALYDSNDSKTGLIDRDKAIGLWKLKGPISGDEYVVDLHPSSSQEQVNKDNLSAWISESRQWAIDNATTDPLLADEYNNLASYIEKHFMHPALDPKYGFSRNPEFRIPKTSIRFNPDPFDAITGATGAVGYSFQTIRDVIERVGGRAMRQAASDAATLDTVMRKVEAISANPQYGYAAQTKAVLSALKSHGWNEDQFARWDETIAEPVLASGQNRLSPTYDTGDTIVGSGVVLTKEDMDALKLMKQWGDAIIAAAPNHVADRLADFGITRKAIGNGKFTGHRVAAPWTRQFMVSWNKASTDQDRLNLLKDDLNLRRVVLGYVAEYNPEFNRMNPASSDKSPLFQFYRRLANTEKQGVQKFHTWDQIVDFIANEMVSDGVSPDYTTAHKTVTETMLSEIGGFVKAFETNVLGHKATEVWGGVPSAVVQTASANNSFTIPRGRLQAPSTFYTYSTASDGRRLNHVGSLRSLLNLKLLQSGYEARAALEAKKGEMKNAIDKLMLSGLSGKAATKKVLADTVKNRKLREIRYDYREIVTALQAIEQAFGNLERYEAANADHYEHAGVAAWNNVFGTIKSSLLSSTQAISTNFWSGTLLGPAVLHWQTGQFLRSILDVVPAPHMWKTLVKRVSALMDDNPQMSKLLRMHAPMWNSMAESIIKAAADWRRVQQIAQSSGMVNPYNLRTTLSNKAALKRSSGRLTVDDPHKVAEWANAILSAPGIRHATETLKAVAPRIFDNIINYSIVEAWNGEVEFLKKLGWSAFKQRETDAAQSGIDWKDLSNEDNILAPEDLGLKTKKGLERYRQLFVPLGSLDAVLLDFYERTKGMTPEQREAEPLLDPDDHAALALQYASISNVATETNRPFALKGKGSDGVWRNIIGTFMGWSINMMKQFSKALQTHSGDPESINGMVSIATIILLLAAVGAWNWEFGDELTKKLYGQSSARIQPGNIKDWQTGLTYFAQSLVNTIPVIGSSIGSLFGVAFTGRGTPFDMASLSPHIGFVADVWNTVNRIRQTGDATLPLADFTKRWIPMSKIAINRLPIQRGILDQQNAIRSLNASAPPGTEIKWGQRGGGNIKYGPANDEIQRLIAAAYEATGHGGSQAEVSRRLEEAITAYVKAGRSPDDAEKAVATALAAKEPVRVLTGREMTPEEEARWVKRMTPDQLVDYRKAQAAWQLLGLATGKDFNMVSTGRSSSGGGGGIQGMPSMLPTAAAVPSMPRVAAIGTLPSVAPFRPSSSVGRISSRRTGIRRGRRTRSVLRSPRRKTPGIRTRRVGIRRPRRYASV